MRLSTSLSQIKGVGPKTSDSLAKQGLVTVGDMLDLLPRRYDDFSGASSIADLRPGKVVVRARCEAISTRHVRRGMKITTATLSDDSGKVKAVWFNQPYRENQLKSKAEFVFSGEFGFKYNQYQITNPSVELAKSAKESEASDQELILPVYKLGGNLKQKTLRDIVKQLAPFMDFLPETLPKEILKRHDLIGRAEAVKKIHLPKNIDEANQARRRFEFEELFEMMLAAQLNKKEQTKLRSEGIRFDASVVQDFVKRLPFELTNAQRLVAWQVFQDIELETPMNRLLQGDVGSGKTVVAGLVVRQVAEAKMQSVLMAPTEILAAQHAKTLDDLLSPFGVKTALLTGSVKGEKRKILLENIASGEIDLVVGTHALIQKGVDYHNLAFVVIDEQHRFGVKQRQALLEKSKKMPHMLSMTATPIPRSLALTLYGELEISILNELPKGRKPIDTKIWSPASVEKMYDAINGELKSGRQAYVICPLIDENVENDKKSVEAEYRKLSKTVFRDYKVGLLHGKMKPAEKEAVMSDFSRGEIDILVSTTVVEVGVDVPNATVILIENADNFGLSQLHQLRGRVGRGEHKSYCHLMMSGHDKPSARLKEIEKSQDGFYLAEADLRLRGPGEIYGRAQHGVLNLKIANLSDTKLLAEVQEEAKRFVQDGEDLLQYKELAEAVSRYQRVVTLN